VLSSCKKRKDEEGILRLLADDTSTQNGAQSPRRPRVQAPKGRHIPAQGGDAKRATNIRIALCVKGGGGWRAFFARRAAGTLGYRTQKRESPEGATYRAATIGRPFRALFPLRLDPGFRHRSEDKTLAADASTLGWDISPLRGLYPWRREHFLSILSFCRSGVGRLSRHLEQQLDEMP